MCGTGRPGALGVALRRAFEEELHAEADPKYRLAQGRQQFRQAGTAQPLHRIRRRSDARQENPR